MFVHSLDEDMYYVDHDAARDALRRRQMFNVIDTTTGWKLDFIVRKNRPFSRSEFERRVPRQVVGVSLFVATAEDTVIAKLEWAAAAGGSERQLRDVRGIIDVQGDRLDRAYVERWVAQLALDEMWSRAQAAAG